MAKAMPPGTKISDISKIRNGTVINVRWNKKQLKYYVYAVLRNETDTIFHCIKLKRMDAKYAKIHPDWLDQDLILSYGGPVIVKPENIISIDHQINSVRAKTILGIQLYFLLNRKKPPKSSGAKKNLKSQKSTAQEVNYHINSKSSIDTYYVTDKVKTSGTGICPICNSITYSQQYNIPAYQQNGDFHSYYTANLYCCMKCHNYFISEKEFHKLVEKVNSQPGSHYLSPRNMTKKYDNISKAYLYAPIATEFILFKNLRLKNETKPAGRSNSGQNESLPALQDKSFLADMGYNTSVPQGERRAILDSAVRKHGKRKVTDHIRFLIKMRESQSDGAIKYEHAISTWQNDLNYIASSKN